MCSYLEVWLVIMVFCRHSSHVCTWKVSDFSSNLVGELLWKSQGKCVHSCLWTGLASVFIHVSGQVWLVCSFMSVHSCLWTGLASVFIHVSGQVWIVCSFMSLDRSG